MRRAIGWRGELLLLFEGALAEARKGEADVTNARVEIVAGVWNADAFAIMRPREMVREIGAMVRKCLSLFL